MPLAGADEDAARSAAIYSELAKAFGALLRLNESLYLATRLALVVSRD